MRAQNQPSIAVKKITFIRLLLYSQLSATNAEGEKRECLLWLLFIVERSPKAGRSLIWFVYLGHRRETVSGTLTQATEQKRAAAVGEPLRRRGKRTAQIGDAHRIIENLDLGHKNTETLGWIHSNIDPPGLGHSNTDALDLLTPTDRTQPEAKIIRKGDTPVAWVSQRYVRWENVEAFVESFFVFFCFPLLERRSTTIKSTH